MPTTNDVSSAIDLFLKAGRCEEIEKAADQLCAAADIKSADALLYRLGDSPVQEDPDVEDAVCSALVRLGIMEKLGNLNFHFLPRANIDGEAASLVYERYRRLIPSKYFK